MIPLGRGEGVPTYLTGYYLKSKLTVKTAILLSKMCPRLSARGKHFLHVAMTFPVACLAAERLHSTPSREPLWTGLL